MDPKRRVKQVWRSRAEAVRIAAEFEYRGKSRKHSAGSGESRSTLRTFTGGGFAKNKVKGKLPVDC
jgi:hypothetical protein